MSLSTKHRDDLRGSVITDEVIAAAGLYTEADGDKVKELLGNYLSVKVARAMGQCLVFLYHDPAGEPMQYADGHGDAHPFVRLKPDNPRPKKDEKGRFNKYESPAGASPRAYFPPNTRAAVLSDPAIPLLVCEGEKKALCADCHGFRCIGLGGVWAWQTKRPENAAGDKTGPRVLIPDLAAVAWTGRRVTIVFDSDIAENSLIQSAEWHLAEALRAAGAVVKVARFPGGDRA